MAAIAAVRIAVIIISFSLAATNRARTISVPGAKAPTVPHLPLVVLAFLLAVVAVVCFRGYLPARTASGQYTSGPHYKCYRETEADSTSAIVEPEKSKAQSADGQSRPADQAFNHPSGRLVFFVSVLAGCFLPEFSTLLGVLIRTMLAKIAGN